MIAARWACVVAALGAAAYLLLDPATADHAAQVYRAGLIRDAGIGVWDNGWFAGHHTPAYSLLSPVLGALLGVRLAGALAAIAAAGLFGLIAQRRWGARAGSVAAAWFAVGAVATLFSGRLTFMLGVAIGVGALLALQRERWILAAAVTAVTTLASPVAGLFVAIAAVALSVASYRQPDRLAFLRGMAVAAAALATGVILAMLFPEGGTEPFVASAFWPALAAIALVAVALPAREQALRAGAALYALACVAAYVLPTALGGNVTRLGALVAGPVLAGALLSARSRVAGTGTTGVRPSPRSLVAGTSLAGVRQSARSRVAGRLASAPARAVCMLLAVLALSYWQLYPPVRDVARASGDPSTSAAYHAPVVRFLERRPGTFRVEIPFTENHWEAAYVAPHVPLARGWERQLDRRYGALFYDGTLSAATYRAWLDRHAVAYVAVPDVPLDHSALEEAHLISRGLPYLREIWSSAHWRVYAVRRPAPLVAGAARTIRVEPDGFVLGATRRGEVLVRMRHTRWWAVTSGHACVERGPGEMTRVRIRAPGTVRVQARLGGSACRR